MKSILLALLSISSFVHAEAQWQLTGNSGTNPNKNRIGTNDDKTLNFRVNNEKAGTINKKLVDTKQMELIK